jgi:hypothetical protein
MAEPAAKATNVYLPVARVKWRIARRVVDMPVGHESPTRELPQALA